MTTTEHASAETSAALAQLRTAIGSLAFGLADDPQAWRARARRIDAGLAGHLARLRDLDAPLLVVFGGVTGAGKSTVVNTLAGTRLVATGVIRPTTYGPTLLCHPGERAWFVTDRILAALPRAHDTGTEGRANAGGGSGDAGVLRLVPTDALRPGLALVDAPDVDSIADANRDLADGLLDAADVWLWFTTAGKYADEESMRYLRRAAERRTALAVALTQVRDADAAAIVADFRAKLAAADLADVDLFVVPYTSVTDERLPEVAVAELRAWLAGMAEPATRRTRRHQTLQGALDALPAEIATVTAAHDEELRTARLLLDDADAAYDRARRDFAEAIEQGLPLQAEVLGRWNRFVGTGRFLKLAEQASGQARAWVRGLLAGPVGAEESRLEREVRVEVGDTVTALAAQLGDLAAAETSERWSRTGAGRRLVAAEPGLTAADPQLRDRAEAATAAWQEHVVAMVETKGADRRVKARWLSTVVNAAATGAIVVALAHTGGLTGAEAGLATGAAAANQALLVKLLGANNVRWLVGEAKADLRSRFDGLAAGERRRFAAAVAEAAPVAGQREDLGAAVTALKDARR